MPVKKKAMATVYKVEIVSHWIAYTDEQIKEMVLKALESEGNEITVKIDEGR